MRTAVILACFAASSEEAAAGAWTRAAGEGFSSQEVRYLRNGADGDSEFASVALTLFAEYGLTEDLTLGVKADQSMRVDDVETGAQSGRVGGFVRYAVWRGREGDVASVEIGGATAISDFQAPETPAGDTSTEISAAGLYGRGFGTDYGDAWVDGSLGLSYFTGARATEVKLDLTAGLRPDDDWVALAQVFSSFSLRDERGFGAPDFDAVKARLSVGRRVYEDTTVLLGVGRDLHTRGFEPAWEISVTIWSPFSFDFSE